MVSNSLGTILHDAASLTNLWLGGDDLRVLQICGWAGMTCIILCK